MKNAPGDYKPSEWKPGPYPWTVQGGTWVQISPVVAVGADNSHWFWNGKEWLEPTLSKTDRQSISERALWIQNLSNEEYNKLVKVTPVTEDSRREETRDVGCILCPVVLKVSVPSGCSLHLLPELAAMMMSAHTSAHDEEAKAYPHLRIVNAAIRWRRVIAKTNNQSDEYREAAVALIDAVDARFDE